MKLVRKNSDVDDPKHRWLSDETLTSKDIDNIALLDLVANGVYIADVGVKDDPFYMLVVSDIDKEWASWATNETLWLTANVVMIQNQIIRRKGELDGQYKEILREMGKR
tara:strand:- start:2393 stop:2719 length:327 start_codon:yes stop_codon:yes gene_type:complete